MDLSSRNESSLKDLDMVQLSSSNIYETKKEGFRVGVRTMLHGSMPYGGCGYGRAVAVVVYIFFDLPPASIDGTAIYGYSTDLRLNNLKDNSTVHTYLGILKDLISFDAFGECEGARYQRWAPFSQFILYELTSSVRNLLVASPTLHCKHPLRLVSYQDRPHVESGYDWA